ncbi:MAG: alpha/beta fold hydrolase [Nanoarchaeota archaeon]|nr:alpha/beta fold hydrolase [Nanoarchaeota archaeon]MBU4351847.1 alpha/beta fold hydrolase [Nanoarchaeota archaeon]
MEIIKKIIKNSYNENIVCEINKAENSKEITILILHAFTGKKENRTINFLAKQLPKKYYNTLQFDFSGHGESEGILQEATISKQLKDIKSILSKLAINKIILIGNSFSVLTALAFAKDNSSVKGLILISGRANYIEYIKNLEKVGDKYKLFDETYVGENFVEDYKKYDPVKNIKELDVPILIVHGDKDEVVPVKDAQIFQDNAKQGTLRIIEGADHRYSNMDYKKKVLDESVNFLNNLDF